MFEILNFDKRFNGVDKEKQEKILKFKHCSAEMLKNITQDKNGDIKLLSTGNFEGYTTEDNIEDTTLINCCEVITFPSGGTASIKYHNGKFIDSGNILASSKDSTKINLKYVYYSLLNINQDIQALYRGSSIQHPSMSEIIELSIPLPPLATQLAIVEILDKFTELEKELEKELEMRKKQYQYYRDKLLTFTEEERERWGVREVKIGEIGKICMCKRIFKDQTNTNGDVPFFKIGTYGGEPDAYISQELFEEYKNNFEYPKKGYVLLSTSGTIGKAIIFDGENAYYQDSNIVWIKNDEKEVLNKYLFYLYKRINWKTDGGGTIQRLYNKNIESTEISIPSLSRQREIVEILDKFDTLVNDISKGLPREIELRKKQYEYYRERLVGFG